MSDLTPEFLFECRRAIRLELGEAKFRKLVEDLRPVFDRVREAFPDPIDAAVSIIRTMQPEQDDNPAYFLAATAACVELAEPSLPPAQEIH